MSASAMVARPREGRGFKFDTHVMIEATLAGMEAIEQERPQYIRYPDKMRANGVSEPRTSMDEKAEEACVAVLSRAYDDILCIGEERGAYALDTKFDTERCCYIDGLDGTKEILSGRNALVGAVLSYLEHGVTLAACVGSYLTRDVYAWGPGIDGVRRFRSAGGSVLISPPGEQEPKPYSVLFRREPTEFLPITRELLQKFGRPAVRAGSVGVGLSHLWEGNYRAYALSSDGKVSYWDLAGPLAISEALGFVRIMPTPDGTRFMRCPPGLPSSTPARGHDEIVIHKNDLSLVPELV